MLHLSWKSSYVAPLLSPAGFAILLLVPAVASAPMEVKMVRDPLDFDRTYRLANLIFPVRPSSIMRRMYPHLIPFTDMLHPVIRSFQFGFPEVLRSGTISDVPSRIDFYTKPSNASSSSTMPAELDKHLKDIMEWIYKQDKKNARPVTLHFKTVVNETFDLEKDLLGKLDPDINYTRVIAARIKNTYPTKVVMEEYLYRDYYRSFLIGFWQSMKLDSVFHAEEHVWDELNCPNVADVLCFWRRYILIVVSTNSIYIDDGNQHLILPTTEASLYSNADSMAVAFWFFYCKMLISKGTKYQELLDQYCPNPCRTNPCVDMANALTDSCEVQGSGLFEKDFKCGCEKHAMWSTHKQACVLYDRCKVDSSCSWKGTESCHIDAMTNELRCFCKAGFMGDNCNELRNACFERQKTKRAIRPTGNRACNVDAGNVCLPLSGSDVFNCRCSNGWLMDIHYANGSEPNCQRRPDPCLGRPCEAGDCVSGGEEAACQCPATHYGTNCQSKRGLWSMWGPWSSCDPDCGDRRSRHRSRDCLGANCLGHAHESVWCPGPVNCGVPKTLGVYRTDRWRTASVLRHLLITLALGVAICAGVLFTCQCCLSVVLRCDRGLLDGALAEKAHTHQLLTYRRLSYKTAFRSKDLRVHSHRGDGGGGGGVRRRHRHQR